MSMNYEAYYFVDDNGSEPVRDYIMSLPVNSRAKIYAFIDYVSA